MRKIELTRVYTPTKARADIKTEMMDLLRNFLIQTYGEDAVKMLRIEKTNVLGAMIATGVGTDGEENPVVVTFNPMVREFSNHSSEKKTYTPFDFYAAADNYDAYVEEKLQKEEESQKNKEAKRKKDEAARAEAKAKVVNTEF